MNCKHAPAFKDKKYKRECSHCEIRRVLEANAASASPAVADAARARLAQLDQPKAAGKAGAGKKGKGVFALPLP
jgi:hypothetical protein